MTQTIPETTAETIVSCIEALSKREGDIPYISSYIHRSPGYVKRAISMGEQINIFNNQDGVIQLSPNTASLLNRANGDLMLVFKEAVFNYKPFILFIDYILNGEDLDVATRKIKAVFNIESNEKIILRSFTNFAKNCGLNPLSQEKLREQFPQKGEQYQCINRIISHVNNKIEGQLFVSEKLGNSCYDFISDPERKLLVDSLLKVSKQPANAVEDAAGAFESYLRRIGKDRSIDLQKCNGIDEIGQLLASKENRIILPEHRKMCTFISTFRNPAVHKVHKTVLDHWQIESDSAIEIILLTMTSMRSIFAYIYKDEKLVL